MYYLEAKLFSIRLTFTLHTCTLLSENRLYWSSFCCAGPAAFFIPFALFDGTTLFDTPFLPNNLWCCVSTVIVESEDSFDCCSDKKKTKIWTKSFENRISSSLLSLLNQQCWFTSDMFLFTHLGLLSMAWHYKSNISKMCFKKVKFWRHFYSLDAKFVANFLHSILCTLQSTCWCTWEQ